MSYTPPSGDAVNATWVGAPAYTVPAGDAVNVTWQASPDLVTGAGALVLDFVLAGTAYHGLIPTAQGALVLDFTLTAEARHGVAGTGALTLSFAMDGEARHGVAGAGDLALGFSFAAEATHPRYELRGEVRLDGVLVNRRVYGYLRETGELLGTAETVAGRFRVHAGFAEVECFVTPIDMDPAAVDWRPPTANRIKSVLADDTL